MLYYVLYSDDIYLDKWQHEYDGILLILNAYMQLADLHVINALIIFSAHANYTFPR